MDITTFAHTQTSMQIAQQHNRGINWTSLPVPILG